MSSKRIISILFLTICSAPTSVIGLDVTNRQLDRGQEQITVVVSSSSEIQLQYQEANRKEGRRDLKSDWNQLQGTNQAGTKEKPDDDDDDDTDDVFFINPCTGSLSTEEHTEPCPLGLKEKITNQPTIAPTSIRTKIPTAFPTEIPTTGPTASPTSFPTLHPSKRPTNPTKLPTSSPTKILSKVPTKAPTNYLTKVESPSPTTKITKPNIISCPNNDCDFTDVDSENTVIIPFKYKVETLPEVTNSNMASLLPVVSAIDTFLQPIEEKLLTELAGELLKHCLNYEGNRKRTLLESSGVNGGNELIRIEKKRTLVRWWDRQDVTGICSDPMDKPNDSITCTPEVDGNNCFVIDGGVTVSIDDVNPNSISDLADKVRGAIKEKMDDDKLLSPDYEEIEKITFLDDEGTDTGGSGDGHGNDKGNNNENDFSNDNSNNKSNEASSDISNDNGDGNEKNNENGNDGDGSGKDNENGSSGVGNGNIGGENGNDNENDTEKENDNIPISVPGETNRSSEDEGVIIGTSVAVVAVMLLAGLFGRKRFTERVKNNDVDDAVFGMVQFPAISTDSSKSFVCIDASNLGKAGTSHDVHKCKSTTCAKCYLNPRVTFLPAPRVNMQYSPKEGGIEVSFSESSLSATSMEEF